ncbi:hypothetical protein [Luteimonas sp. MC1750]|uniref:hypothetical protein n=1 Tax=Luteimonas sp. MC1750 TaxID=2799326 RepID=UPI0018F0F5FB|nr:hypothetical protein [Luteimonas sp. MC1750]MBJ6984497.1 hypothetical protein [Luteimonas sp. MC1750]QQO04891.1 hypothetical protein JGR68_08310 [Luteimonas sp. MC1750]
MNNDKMKVLSLQELEQVSGGRKGDVDAAAWSTMSRNCGGVGASEWSTISAGCPKEDQDRME